MSKISPSIPNLALYLVSLNITGDYIHIDDVLMFYSWAPLYYLPPRCTPTSILTYCRYGCSPPYGPVLHSQPNGRFHLSSLLRSRFRPRLHIPRYDTGRSQSRSSRFRSPSNTTRYSPCQRCSHRRCDRVRSSQNPRRNWQ